MSVFASMNEQLQEALATVLPETALMQLLVDHALLVVTIALILFVLVFLAIALFFDFVADVWKLPIAAGVDVLKYLSLSFPWLGFVAAIVGALLFILLSDAPVLKWVFAAVSLAAGVLTFFWGGLVTVTLIAILPLNTVMMFIATIID